MRLFIAVLVGIFVTALALFGTGIVACILGLAWGGGNMPILFAVAGVGIPFSFYVGYLTVRFMLRSSPEDKGSERE